MRIFFSALVFLSLLLTAAARADVNVSTAVDPQVGTTADSFEVTVTVKGDNLTNVSPPEFLPSDAFTIQPRGTATEHTVVNGYVSNSMVFTFSVTPSTSLKPGKVKIPGGSVSINGIENYFRPIEIEIQSPSTAKQQQDSRQPRYGDIDFTHIVDNTAPYIGEQLMYSVKVVATADFEQPNLGSIELSGFAREDLGNQRETSRVIPGTRSQVHTVREALFPLKAGALIIPERSFSANIRVPKRYNTPGHDNLFPGLFPDLFGSVWYDLQPRRLRADAIALNVRPLPPAPANAPASIPVGQMIMRTAVSATQVKQGESITLSVVVSGDGNLRPLELDKPKDPTNRFNFYFDKPTIETELRSDRLYFTKTFKVAVIPNISGTLELPRFQVLTFNPKAGKYETLQSEAHSIEVTPNDKYVAPPVSSSAGHSETTDAKDHKDADGKQDITVLREDLLPQHIDDSALSRPLLLSQRTTDVVSIITLLVGLGLVAFGTVKKFKLQKPADRPSLAELRNRMQSAQGSTQEIVDELAEIVRSFIGTRLALSVMTLTGEELASIVRQKIKNSNLADDIRALFARFENYRYGSTNETAIDTLRSEAERVVNTLSSEYDRANPQAKRRLLSLLVPFLFSGILFGSLTARADNVDELAKDAATQFNNGNYTDATKLYQEIIAIGARNGHQYYNLANAFYRDGQLGEAILNYRLALELMPNDPDVKANLDFARKQTADKIGDDANASDSGAKSFANLFGSFSIFQLRLALLCCGIAFWGLVSGKVFKRVTVRPSVIVISGMVWFALFIATKFLVTDRLGTPIFALSAEARSLAPGVILSKEVKVYSGDSERYQVIFLLHEGAEVLTREQRGDWIEVLLPKGRKGWVGKQDIGLVL